MKRYREKEESMRNELNEGKKAVDDVLKAEGAAKARVEEVEEALRESTLALENARAEIEALRSDAAAADVAAAEREGTEGQRSEELSGEATRLQAEVDRLQILLQEAESASVRAAEHLDSDSESDWRARYEEEHESVLLLQRSLDETSSELETTRKKLNRDTPIGARDESTLASPTSPQHDPAEITGFKHIVQDLQKENSVLSQRSKLLESENRLLMSETDQLRQELKALEENIEQSLLREEEALDFSHSSSGTHGITDKQKAQFESEMHELRQRLVDAEMKSEKMSKNLNMEISELEALIESKIYREEELEQEVERLNTELVGGRSKGRKGSLASPAPRPGKTSTTAGMSPNAKKREESEEVCEICERPGHDIFTCDLLQEGTTSQGNGLVRGQTPRKASDPSDLFCEDCESHGHVAADCPHSMDVF